MQQYWSTMVYPCDYSCSLKMSLPCWTSSYSAYLDLLALDIAVVGIDFDSLARTGVDCIKIGRAIDNCFLASIVELATDYSFDCQTNSSSIQNFEG